MIRWQVSVSFIGEGSEFRLATETAKVSSSFISLVYTSFEWAPRIQTFRIY